MDEKRRYLMLLLVAVRSLKALHPKIRCVCVYSGCNSETIAAIKAEGMELAHYQHPVLDDDLLPVSCRHVRGAYLKLELALVPELADESKVLYCDVDVMFLRSLDSLWDIDPPYMAMARENTTPFFPEIQEVDYEWRGRRYAVKLPFPIWTFSSGVVLFNLEKLRAHDYIKNFLAFAAQTTERIGNFDQSLINYFFGKRILKLDQKWNKPPYFSDCLDTAHIVHFHGPKPWASPSVFPDLQVYDYLAASQRWFSWLTADEVKTVHSL